MSAKGFVDISNPALELEDARLPRHPEKNVTIVEIQESKLCIYPSHESPMYIDLKQAKKILPKLVEFILNGD